jgi:hypothetical protein
VGAIDGTHVLARVPRSMQQPFRDRHKHPTQNVMAAVNFNLKFTYVLVGWEGSAHDAHVLDDAIERDDGFIVPKGITCCTSLYIVVHSIETYLHYRLCFDPFVGKFYLVDAGYACRNGFLPPYRGVWYHLSKYGGKNYPNNALG